MRASLGRLALVAVALVGGCARPAQIDEDQVLREIAGHFREFFPVENDPDPQRDTGLLRPRFGLPAIVRVGSPFPLELLERGAPSPVRASLVRHDLAGDAATACVRAQVASDGCTPLVLGDLRRQFVAPNVMVARTEARTSVAIPPGGYDLVIDSAVDAPHRVPRAVWLRDEDPAAPRALAVAHLSDLHIGKADEPHLEDHLVQVIADLEAGHPDLVVVTGDVVHRGSNGDLQPRAAEFLATIDAPVVAIVGNHDLGYGRPDEITRYWPGWPNFARSFHPFLLFQFSLGGWDFVGFDTGPSVFTARVLTRGLSPETIARVRSAIELSAHDGKSGVILFGHAPTRAIFFAGSSPTAAGILGQMQHGARELEGVILAAAARGQRVIELAGHTHWAQLFESRDLRGVLELVRSPSLPLCPRPIDGRAALVIAQSATRTGLTENGRGWGYDWLHLGDPPTVAFRRFGTDVPLCPAR